MLFELLGTGLFFAAVSLSAVKVNEDFGEAGLRGYMMLILLIAIYAGAIGAAFA